MFRSSSLPIISTRLPADSYASPASNSIQRTRADLVGPNSYNVMLGIGFHSLGPSELKFDRPPGALRGKTASVKPTAAVKFQTETPPLFHGDDFGRDIDNTAKVMVKLC
jgi:hypothetical protein